MAEIWEQLERRRAELARHEGNRAGVASTFIKVHTDGQGSFQFEEASSFEVPFVEEPWIQIGTFVDADRIRADLGLADDAVPLPHVTAHVIEWDLSGHDFYVGAWIGVQVSFPPFLDVPLDYMVPVDHYFTFTAIALKGMGV